MNIQLTEKAQPWYRYRWPWILMLGPFVVVLAGVFTAYLAIVSDDGLVDDDYYKQGLAVNQETAREQRAVTLGLQADVMQNVEAGQVRVFLRTPQAVLLPRVIQLRFAHPTRAGADQNVLLMADGAGSYSGKLKGPLVGRWLVSLEDEQRDWRLSGDWTPEKTASLQLPLKSVGNNP